MWCAGSESGVVNYNLIIQVIHKSFIFLPHYTYIYPATEEAERREETEEEREVGRCGERDVADGNERKLACVSFPCRNFVTASQGRTE